MSSLTKLNPLKFLQPLGSCANYCQLALNAQLSLKLRLNWLRLRTWNLFLGKATRLLAWDLLETVRVMGLAVKGKKKSVFLVLLSFTLGLTWHSRWNVSCMIWMCLHCLSGTELRAFENLEPEWAKHPSVVLKQNDQILFCWLCLEGTTLALCYWPVVGTAHCHSV